MTQQPSDNMEDAPNEMGSEEGMAPDGGSNSSGEGETGGSSQNSEEGGEPNNENGGSGGQGNPSEESNDGKGENASADRGGPPSDTNDGNSDNDMPGDNNPESEAELTPEMQGQENQATTQIPVSQETIVMLRTLRIPGKVSNLRMSR